MWFYDPYEVEWRLGRRAAQIRRGTDAAGGNDTAPARTTRGPRRRARRLSLALRVLMDANVATQVAEALAPACDCCTA